MTEDQEAALRQALGGDRPLLTLEDLLDEVASEHGRFLYPGARSVIFVHEVIYEGTGERVIEVGPAAGDLEEIAALLPAMEKWAADHGCTQVHLVGRRGWVRALAQHGYEEYATVVRKVLTRVVS